MINNEKAYLNGIRDAKNSVLPGSLQHSDYYEGWQHEHNRLESKRADQQKKAITRSASSLQYNHEQNHPDSKFFSRARMHATGDYLSNFGVRLTKVRINSKSFLVYELYRRQPNLKGYKGSDYFSTETYDLININDTYVC